MQVKQLTAGTTYAYAANTYSNALPAIVLDAALWEATTVLRSTHYTRADDGAKAGGDRTSSSATRRFRGVPVLTFAGDTPTAKFAEIAAKVAAQLTGGPFHRRTDFDLPVGMTLRLALPREIKSEWTATQPA